MKRKDGRKIDETREIKCKAHVLDRADGSAEFSFGKSKALASVFGPREMHPDFMKSPQKAILRCHYDMISFSVTERKRPGPTRRSSEISLVTTKALTPVIQLSEFPYTAIDVFIMITQADASTRCAGINAATMALAAAGIPMKDLPIAVSVGKLGKQLVLDVNKDEEDYEEKEEPAATDIVFTILPRTEEISLLQLDGDISPEELKEAIKMAKKAVPKILEKMIKALKEVAK